MARPPTKKSDWLFVRRIASSPRCGRYVQAPHVTRIAQKVRQTASLVVGHANLAWLCPLTPNQRWLLLGLVPAKREEGERTPMPLWVTEIGTVDEVRQADYLENVYRLARDGYPDDVERVFWFCWSDGMVPPFGLLRGDGQPKPAYQRYDAMSPPW